MNKSIKIIALITAGILASCSGSGPADQPEEQQPSGQEPEALFLTTEQLRYSDIAYGKVEMHIISNNINAKGELVLPVNSAAGLSCIYPGTIRQVNVRVGEKVSRGQVLARLSSLDFIEAQQRYLMVRSQLGMLEQEYERQKTLNKDKVSSDKYFQQASAEYHAALAEFKGLSLKLEMAGANKAMLDEGEFTSELEIISPITGHIEHIRINPGDYVTPEDQLLQVINREELLLELRIFEKDIMNIKEGQQVSFSLSNLGNELYRAEIISIGNMVNPESRDVRVLAEIKDQHDMMRPGMFAASEIKSEERMVQAVPEEASVRTGSNEYIIFYTTPDMQKEEGTYFNSLPVSIGSIDHGMTAITLLDDIPDNALIVTKGTYYLKTERAKQEE